jgi:hypothetical protein
MRDGQRAGREIEHPRRIKCVAVHPHDALIIDACRFAAMAQLVEEAFAGGFGTIHIRLGASEIVNVEAGDQRVETLP